MATVMEETTAAAWWTRLAAMAILAGGAGFGAATWLHGARHDGPAVSAKVGETARGHETASLTDAGHDRSTHAATTSHRPTVTRRWLVGRWTMLPGNPCTDPGGIAYAADGTFGQDEGGGHYRIVGKRIVFDRFFTWGDEAAQVPDPGPANLQPVRAIDADTMIVGTTRYVRCHRTKGG